MAVGFRSFLSVDPGEPVIKTLIQHLEDWLAAKNMSVVLETTGYHARNQNDIVTVLRERRRDTWMYRWRRHHPFALGASEMYRTTVTAVEHDDGGGWLWTEIETPSDSELEATTVPKYMSVPMFLRSVIGDLNCRDGRTPVAAEPQWIAQSHLPDVMDYLADETRRGPVYMVNQGGRPAYEFEPWAREVTWQVISLGAVFLLDDQMAREFNEMVGVAHSVHPGTIRTFQPDVNLDDADPERHRMLSRQRIMSSTCRHLGYILGTTQRERAAQTALPEHVLDANRVLNEYERRLRERTTRNVLRLVKSDGGSVLTPHENIPAPTEPAELLEERMSAAELATEVVRLRQENVDLKRVVACHESAREEMHAVLRTQTDHLKAVRARTREVASNGHGQLSVL